MPSAHSEITAYINEGDLARVAAALTALCASEGLRVAAQPHSTCVRQVLEPSNAWTFALLPGAPGWTIVHAQPWNVLCTPAATDQTRFVDLCTTLGARGYLVDVISIDPNGGMLVETDGRGTRRLSGWYMEAGTHDLAYHGTPLEDDDFTGLTTFEFCADLDSAQSFRDKPGVLTMDGCMAIARDVGGANGKLFWTSGEDFSGAWSTIQQAMLAGGPLPVPGGMLLEFEAEPPGFPDAAPRGGIFAGDVRGLGHECAVLGDFSNAAACYKRAMAMGDKEAAQFLAKAELRLAGK